MGLKQSSSSEIFEVYSISTCRYQVISITYSSTKIIIFSLSDDDCPSIGSAALDFSDMDMDFLDLDQEEIRRYSGISFRSGAYRKSIDRDPIISQLEASKEIKTRDRKKKEGEKTGDKRVGRLTRRLSQILSAGELKFGDSNNISSCDTTPMIAEEKTLGLGKNVSSGLGTSVTPAPLRKGFTRKGLREKQAAQEKETLAKNIRGDREHLS